MARRQLAGVLTISVAAFTAVLGCTATDQVSNDEVYDFRETTTTEVRGSTPYDTYVLLAEQAGIEFLDLREAETRAQELCADTGLVSGAVEERSVQDSALVAAFCPGGAPDSADDDSGAGG